MKLHPSLTPERISKTAMRAIKDLDYPGLCIECGHEQGGCEPDASKLKCESCGQMAVYGAEELWVITI